LFTLKEGHIQGVLYGDRLKAVMQRKYNHLLGSSNKATQGRSNSRDMG
jgi:hypothetical protein